MKKIRTLIVDDEPLAREGIAMMLEGDSEVELVGSCGDGQEAVNAIRTTRPDLVYLDVQMPRLGGFEALEKLPTEEWPTVIFVTAYEQYAVQAFEAGAVGYLLKPFRDRRFHEALGRAKEKIRHSSLDEMKLQAKTLADQLKAFDRERSAPVAAAPASRRIGFKVGGDYLFVESDEIIWIEAQGDFIRVCVGNQILSVREAMQDIEQRLGSARHARIHRSYIVNVDRIKRIAPTLYGDYTVLMSDGVKVRLSRSHRDKLKAWLPDHFN